MPKGEVKSEIISLLDGGLIEGSDAGYGVKRAHKKYFPPGESFNSWTNYGKAVWQTPGRFKERVLSRADKSKEVGEIRKRSESDMRRTLNWWDLTWFGFGGVIGTGIFVLTGQEAHKDAGPAIVLSYALSGFSVMLSVFCFTEFAVEIPVAGEKGIINISRLFRLAVVLINWPFLSSGLIGYFITVPVWFLGTAGLAVFVPQCREAKVWGVPMVPWFLPCPFLSTSFSWGLWTIVLLVYYAFFGLHASFDAFHGEGGDTRCKGNELPT